MHLAIAILAALVQRGRTGQGQLVELAMQEAVLNLTRVKFTPTLRDGKPLGRTGNRSATGGYADLIRCAGDGSNEAVYLIIPPDNPEMFTAVTEVIGRPELQKDERFATPPGRARNARVFDAWGFERCLWGTDWTRAFAVVNYEGALEPFRRTDRLSDSERAMLMGGACAKAYGWFPKQG
jgi:crotonobetainyl-CoA:carnitine CoA-transferase CaiB-like acyl-CoA transferase